MADEVRCPGTVCRAAARVELMVTWLPKWSVLWRRCLLPAAAKPVRLNGRLTGGRFKLSRRQIHCRTRRELARATMILRTDGSKVVLNVLRCFAPAQSCVRHSKVNHGTYISRVPLNVEGLRSIDWTTAIRQTNKQACDVLPTRARIPIHCKRVSSFITVICHVRKIHFSPGLRFCG